MMSRHGTIELSVRATARPGTAGRPVPSQNDSLNANWPLRGM